MTALECLAIASLSLIAIGLVLSAVDRYRRWSKKRRAARVARVLLEREARRENRHA